MDGLVTVEHILRRFMEAAHLNTLTEVAAVIGVSSNSISGWKARDSIGILFENIYHIYCKTIYPYTTLCLESGEKISRYRSY